MNKILSLKVVRVMHKHYEGKGITLVTSRPYIVAWLLGLRFTFNIGLGYADSQVGEAHSC